MHDRWKRNDLELYKKNTKRIQKSIREEKTNSVFFFIYRNNNFNVNYIV